MPAAAVEVLKSDVPWMLATAASGAGLDGEMPWPMAPAGLLTLYLNSPEHCRACHITAAGIAGGGLDFERDADAARFVALLDTSSADWGEDMALDMRTFGNAFCELARVGRRVARIQRLPAVTCVRRSGDRLAQIIREPDGTGRVIHFGPGEWLHARTACPGGTWYAYPTWVGGHGMLELAEAAVEFNRRFFSNSAIPEYAVITSGFELSAAAKQATREFFSSEYRGLANSHRTLYIHTPNHEDKITFERITAEAKDLDFARLLDAARDRIPIAHGVPPRMLGIMQAGALGGGGEVEGQLHVFEELTLAPARRRLLSQMAGLLRELGVSHTAGRPDCQWRGIDMTPPDSTDDTQYGAWVAAGILSPEEARALIEADRGAPLAKSAESRRLGRAVRLLGVL